MTPALELSRADWGKQRSTEFPEPGCDWQRWPAAFIRDPPLSHLMPTREQTSWPVPRDVIIQEPLWRGSGLYLSRSAWILPIIVRFSGLSEPFGLLCARPWSHMTWITTLRPSGLSFLQEVLLDCSNWVQHPFKSPLAQLCPLWRWVCLPHWVVSPGKAELGLLLVTTVSPTQVRHTGRARGILLLKKFAINSPEALMQEGGVLR